MKRTYTGLSIRRVTVESNGLLLQGSPQQIKAKTKVQDWGVQEESFEMGLDMELHSLGSSTIEPVSSGTPTP